MKIFADMANTGEERLVLYAQMANLVQMMVDSDDVEIKEVTKDFCRFACNAHTICDEEMRPLGTGLYPVISIINHRSVVTPSSTLFIAVLDNFISTCSDYSSENFLQC
jgi:hypothetical protein